MAALPAKASPPCDILLAGAGFFSERVAFDLAITAEAPVHVAICGRPEAEGDRLQWLCETANARAVLLGRPATFSPVPIVWETPESIAETIAPWAPLVIVHSATLQSPWGIVDQPDTPWARFVNEAGGWGLTGFLQALLPSRVARAIALVGSGASLANACYPDLVNRILSAKKLRITCGLGNIAILAAFFASELEERRPGRVKVLAHHQNLAAFFKPASERTARPPRVWVREKELPDVYPRFAHLRIPRRPTMTAVAGTTAAPVALALAGYRDYQGHLPGPLGHHGGYPIAISDGRLSLDLPQGLTIEDAAEWFRDFEEDEPVRLDADGRLSFSETARSALASKSPTLAEGFHIDDLEAACAEFLEVRRRLLDEAT